MIPIWIKRKLNIPINCFQGFHHLLQSVRWNYRPVKYPDWHIFRARAARLGSPPPQTGAMAAKRSGVMLARDQIPKPTILRSVR